MPFVAVGIGIAGSASHLLQVRFTTNEYLQSAGKIKANEAARRRIVRKPHNTTHVFL
jgi:hypothetical protein